MSRAQRKAVELRRELELHGEVDVEAVANLLGMEVVTWPLLVLKEMVIGDFICVAKRLDSGWRRWVIAHAIGHRLMHPGNHSWIRFHTGLGHRFEREAEDFASSLLLDAREAVDAGLTESWELAEYFGIPDELVRLQAPLGVD